MKYYILSDEKFLAFEWGRAFNAYLFSYAKKHNIELTVPDMSNPPQEGFLLLLGVDYCWMKEIAGQIASTDLIVILLEGDAKAFSGRTVQILHDQPSVIQQSLALLRDCGCTSPALFGVQKNDTSDLKKSEIFSLRYPLENVYYTDNDLTDTFLRLYRNIKKYDSIICANDLFAIFLLKQFKEHGIKVPKTLKVIGNSDLWLSSHITPSLTTACGYDYRTTAELLFWLLKNQTLADTLTNIKLTLKNQMISRETTGNGKTEKSDFWAVSEKNDFDTEFVHCEELKDIIKLNRVLPAFSPTDRKILVLVATGLPYADIAEECFLTYDSVKYHVKKIYGSLGVHNRSALCALLENNLIDIQSLC